MKIAIMQPTFNPWVGYFDLINYCDKFIFLDTVQLTRRSWQTRNRLKISNKEYMFTIPIKKIKPRDDCSLNNTQICYENYDFREKLYNLIERNYKKSKHYIELITYIKKIIFYDTNNLSKYNINLIKSISKLLNYKTEFITLSEEKKIHGKSAELIFNIASMYNASQYISPLGSKNYLNKFKTTFKNNNIDIFYQYYQLQNYNQLGKDFIPNLGVLDLLFNEGIVNTKNIILEGRNYATNKENEFLSTKQQSSHKHKYLSNKLINFTELTSDESLMILQWRNNDNINKWMFNNKNITIKEHLDFIASLANEKQKLYFLVKSGNEYIGVIDFTNITNDTVTVGLYSNPNLKKVGYILINNIISYSFNTLKIKKIIINVLSNNKKAYYFYLKNNFNEVNRKIINNNEIIYMELTNDNR